MTSKTLLTAALAAAIGYTCAALASANIINIMPSKDNTLYEFDPKEGDFSNALGFHFFAGETGMSELRRGVLAFDIAGSIPPGSMITSASLSVICPDRRPTLLTSLSCTSCLPIGARARPSHLEKKVTERRLRRMMPHGGTVSSTRSFGQRKAEIFRPR